MKTLTGFGLIIAITIFFFRCTTGGEDRNGSAKLIGPQPDGSILVPTNQLLRPAGFQVQLPGRPVDMAISPNGKWMAVLNIKTLDLIRVLDRTIIQRLPIKTGGSFNGVTFSKDGKKIYVSQARDNIFIAEIGKNNVLQWTDKITFPLLVVGGHPVPGGIVLNESGDKLYTVLNRNNTFAVVDLKDKSITQIPVGVAPYEVALYSENKVYVSNWGGRHPEKEESSYKSSGTETLVDEETGIAKSGTVSVVDPEKGAEIKSIEVGLHPTAMVFSPGKEVLYVACANSDIISVINTETDEVVDKISVHLAKDLPFGSAPNALDISSDGKRLYVANGTDNAIAVIELGKENRVAGVIPTGWYPGAVLLDKNEKYLIVANTKGIGSRNLRADRPGYNTHNHMGTISFIPMPDENQLAHMTETVKRNNSYAHLLEELNKESKPNSKVVVPQFPGQKSHFKHVVYIIKENRTYDQVFSDMTQGNGDSSLLHFGREVTPNHHALAEQFILMDNYYCSGVLSADGHQWTDEAYVTDYLEKFFGAFPRSYPYDGGDPLAYSPTGFIWDNVMSHGLTFRNYGEFVEASIKPAGLRFTDIYNDFSTGAGKVTITAKCNLPQMKPYTCPTFIGFPIVVSDQYRAAEFIKELKEFEENDNFPNFTILLLPADHTSGTRPGMPTPKAAVADNDLALGLVVEAISHSKFWSETCIFVTEDDPQAGLDHVDGHRTVGLVISPYTKRHKVVSTNYTQINMFRTMENILGIPPLNKFDITAEPMTDCFTNRADYTPYTALPNNIPLDRLNPGLSALSGDALYWAKQSMAQDLDDYDRIDEDTFNRIIWHSVKGYDVPYPQIAKNEEYEEND